MDGKQLVVLAGPHQTSHDGMRRWFDQHATDYDDSTRMGGGWLWPMLSNSEIDILTEHDVGRDSMFRLLFDKESTAPEILLKAIRESWEQAENGIILGDEKFDKIGETPFSHLDALKIVYRIVQNLSIPRQDVTIVLMHRAPRLGHWMKIFDVHSHHADYTEFVCEIDEADKRWEYANSAMNIGMLSKFFLQNGFNVVVVDEEGVKESNSDPSHVVACEILHGVECNGDGQVVGLEDEKTEIEHDDDEEYEDWSGLSLEQLHDLESLFVQRDCLYQSELEQHNQFKILHQNSLFTRCAISTSTEDRRALMDTSFVMNFIQMQKGCESAPVDTSIVVPGSTGFDNGSSRSSSVSASTEVFLITLFLILCASGAFLGYLLCRRHRRSQKLVEAEFDGVFKESPSRSPFRNRLFSDGSTESSSDEESPKTKQNGDIRHVSIQHEKKEQKSCSANLCNACRLVRVDRNCPFCHGGLPPRASTASPTRSSIRTKAAISEILYRDEVGGDRSSRTLRVPQTAVTTTPEFDEGNDKWQLSGTHSHMPWENDDSSVMSLDSHFSFGSQPAELSPRKTRKNEKSKVFRKLKELAKLKNENGVDAVGKSRNLQIERSEEIDFT
jgi:hypothetical protein